MPNAQRFADYQARVGDLRIRIGAALLEADAHARRHRKAMARAKKAYMELADLDPLVGIELVQSEGDVA